MSLCLFIGLLFCIVMCGDVRAQKRENPFFLTYETGRRKQKNSIQLQGISSLSGNNSALIIFNYDTVVVNEHDCVGGYEITIIGDNFVLLKKNNNEIRLVMGE